MKFILKLPLILPVLSACTPDIRSIEPVEVNVPVAVSCSAGAVAAPDWNIPHLDPGASTADKLKAAFADLELSRGYTEELEAELNGCS